MRKIRYLTFVYIGNIERTNMYKVIGSPKGALGLLWHVSENF